MEENEDLFKDSIQNRVNQRQERRFELVELIKYLHIKSNKCSGCLCLESNLVLIMEKYLILENLSDLSLRVLKEKDFTI